MPGRGKAFPRLSPPLGARPVLPGDPLPYINYIIVCTGNEYAFGRANEPNALKKQQIKSEKKYY